MSVSETAHRMLEEENQRLRIWVQELRHALEQTDALVREHHAPGVMTDGPEWVRCPVCAKRGGDRQSVVNRILLRVT